MNLKEKLEDYNNRSLARASEDIKTTMNNAAVQLAESDIKDLAISIGDLLPEFTLKSGLGGVISSKELLNEGALIINYYRGGW